MSGTQAPPPTKARLTLHSERLGPLPLVNHFLQRIGLEELLDQHVPTRDRRSAVAHAKALGVLLRSIIVEREPITASRDRGELRSRAVWTVTGSDGVSGR
jgi:hypothetical protein